MVTTALDGTEGAAYIITVSLRRATNPLRSARRQERGLCPISTGLDPGAAQAWHAAGRIGSAASAGGFQCDGGLDLDVARQSLEFEPRGLVVDRERTGET
jgi:hypothetical protein